MIYEITEELERLIEEGRAERAELSTGEDGYYAGTVYGRLCGLKEALKIITK